MENMVEIVTERGYRFSIDGNISMTARIQGTMTKEVMENALKKAVMKYPIFTSTIVKDDSNHVFYQLYSSKPMEPVYYPYAEVKHINVYLQREEENLFYLDRGPLMRILVFKGQDRSVVALIGHRIVSDATGYRYFLETLVYYMNHPEEEPEVLLPKVMGQEASIPMKSSISLKDKLLIKSLNRDWEKSSHDFLNMKYKEVLEHQKTGHKAPVIMKEINEKSTRSLQNNCVEHNVTVTAAITTAFLAVMHNFDRTHQKDDVRIEVILNHRKEQNAKLVGNISSAVYLEKQYLQGHSFWDNSQRVYKILKKREKPRERYETMAIAAELDGSLLESIPVAAYGGYDDLISKKAAHLFYQGEKEKGLGIENLGVYEYDKDEDYNIDSLYVIPPASLANDITIGAVTVNGRLMISVRYDKLRYSERIMEDMIRAAINYMWNRT